MFYGRMRMFLIAILAGAAVFWLITQVSMMNMRRHQQPIQAITNQ